MRHHRSSFLRPGAPATSRRSLVGSLLVVGLLISACSGSSSTSTTSSPTTPALGGSAKVKTCKNKTLNPPPRPTDEACDTCDATHCASEGTALAGSDPDAFGGACGEVTACLCECEAGDTACLLKCPSVSQACLDAITAARSCQETSCAAACPKKGG